jgi:hypothetical protein
MPNEEHHRHEPAAETQKVLTIVGFIDEERGFQLEPGYAITPPPVASRPPEPTLVNPYCVVPAGPESRELTPSQILVVTVVNVRGDVLARKFIPMELVCSYHDATQKVLFFNDTIPLVEGAKRVEFKHLENLQHAIEINDIAPNVELVWNPPELTQGAHNIEWLAEGAPGTELRYTILYSRDGGETWRPVSLSSPDHSAVINFDDLPGGRGIVRVLATDGVNTTHADSRPFAVPNKGERAFIFEPLDGATYDSREPVLLHGQGWHMERGETANENLVWLSSRQGEIGRGGLIEAQLSPGAHEITLTAGSDAERGLSSVSIMVVAEGPAVQGGAARG